MQNRPVCNQTCPHCGVTLPEQASFCPHCARSVNRRTESRPPKALPGRILRAGAVLLVLLGIALGVFLAERPKEYEGTGEILYTDEDGTYQILLGRPGDCYTPAPQIEQNAEEGGEYRFPVCLYINHVESGANAAPMFLKKVEKVTAEFREPVHGGAVSYTEPAPDDYCPDAAMVGYVDFIGAEEEAEGIWTVTMENGDVLRLRQTLQIRLIQTYDYFPDTTPMDTLEELQALVDEVARTVEPSAVVNVHLPPVAYEGSLVMEGRPVNLYGSAQGDARTTFTDTLRVASNDSWICYIEGVDFVGEGGVGISAAARVHVTDCSFSGWKTAVLAYGYTWVNVQQSRFEQNVTGLHFNASGASVSHTQFTGNEFLNNGTGILLESVPTDVTMKFADCLFSGNGTDIDNRCGQQLDISQAVFQ